ncbi:unnamed protein product [Camellia sinensis]
MYHRLTSPRLFVSFLYSCSVGVGYDSQLERGETKGKGKGKKKKTKTTSFGVTARSIAKNYGRGSGLITAEDLDSSRYSQNTHLLTQPTNQSNSCRLKTRAENPGVKQIIDVASPPNSGAASMGSALRAILKKMSMRHDVYLYVQMDEQVWRVNVSKLGDESQPRPEFELVSDNSNGELPIGMGCISVNSKLYMVGGQKEQQITKDDDDEDDDDSSSEVDYVPNLKSFVLNLDAHPSIRICQDLPSMNGPKFNPLVVSVNDKFYVLARRPICDYGKALDQPVFEVFDPAAVNGGSWKELPRPPWTDPAQFKLGGDYIYHHFVWGHKIVFCTRAGFYVFDTDMKKWDFTDEKLSPFPIISCASAEFDGFLIAMPWDRQQLVAYQLDSDSDATAKPCQVLDELRPVFNPPFGRHEFQGFLTHLGDVDGGHRMCLLYAGYDYYSRWCARVANFRVSISCNDAGDRFPYAYLETLQHYDFEKFDNPARWIDSAFVMMGNGRNYVLHPSLLSGLVHAKLRLRGQLVNFITLLMAKIVVGCQTIVGDYLNNHDVEANARFMDAYPAGSDECDYLNEPYDETNASLTDTYLCGSNELKLGGDYLNNHDVEANARFMDAYPAGSDECDYLNEQYDETNASLTDTYLCGSNEGDYLNNHDVEANARFMDAYPAESDECDYLNEHYDETNARLTDTYLCGSNEGDFLNNHDVEANARFMDAYPAGSDECDYLNELYDETNASLTDTYLCGSNVYYYLKKHEAVADASCRDAYLSRSDGKERGKKNERKEAIWSEKEKEKEIIDPIFCRNYPDESYSYIKCFWPRRANLNGLNVEVDGSFMRARLFGSYSFSLVEQPLQTPRFCCELRRPKSEKKMENNKSSSSSTGGGGAEEQNHRTPLARVVSDCVKRWFQNTLKDAKEGRIWMTRAFRIRSSVWKL